MEQQVEVSANELISVLRVQRNVAMDEAAMWKAAYDALSAASSETIDALKDRIALLVGDSDTARSA